MTTFAARLHGFQARLGRTPPAQLLLLGYLSYITLGWVLLCLPWAQAQPVQALDNLFISASAVSTTGLVTVDPGSAYTWLGELVILLLIQAGGLGYMTFSSFVLLASTRRLSQFRQGMAEAAFSLPPGFDAASFVKRTVLFTVAVELAGAALLAPILRAAGTPHWLWSALFHSVSAFCTAGFSLNANSFEGFTANVPLNLVISALSICGAVGFIVWVDLWENLTNRRQRLRFTSRVILLVTFWFLVVGTAILFLVEPALAHLPADERLLAAFFQTMTASTTVGFDTVPVGGMVSSSIVLLYFLMFFGASPAGTGGGLKSTTFSALWGIVRSTLKGRERVTMWSREIPLERLRIATASLIYYSAIAAVGIFLLCLTEPANFEALLFEALSALGTVGLSMGVTAGLTHLGKLTIIALMAIGRVGVITFGLAISLRDPTAEELADNQVAL